MSEHWIDPMGIARDFAKGYMDEVDLCTMAEAYEDPYLPRVLQLRPIRRVAAERFCPLRAALFSPLRPPERVLVKGKPEPFEMTWIVEGEFKLEH